MQTSRSTLSPTHPNLQQIKGDFNGRDQPRCRFTVRCISNPGGGPFVFPDLEFLELMVNCDSAIEGWLILPIVELSPPLRF